MIQNQRGFTVIELFLAIMIMGILTAAAVPQFNRLLQTYRLKGATNVIWGDLHKARITAIKENRAIQVNFMTTTSYNIVRVGTGQVIYTRNLLTDYPGITVNINNNPMTFGSTGTAGFGGATVQVQNPAGTKNFTILTTGRIGNFS
jgi:prepilin-type N-terminal cleavage/methylation domain-containing protein